MTIEYKDSKRLSGLSSDSTGLKAYWKMNDLSGKLLNTASSQGNTALSGSDLTISGTTGYGATGHIYPVYSYSFTNADGNKAVADNSASDWNFLTNSGNKFTITLWLKIKSNSINADFMGTGGTGSNDFAIRYRGAVADNKFAIFFSNEGEKITSTSTTLTDTNWHFYMIQYDDSVGTLRFQKDAVAVEEFTGLNLTSTGNPTTALGFGDSNGSTSETNGDMQEVTVWDRVLTTAEIAQIYNTGSGAELQNTTIPFGGKPTNVQDNSILVEKDTANRYWFSTALEPTFEDSTFSDAGWVKQNTQTAVANSQIEIRYDGTQTSGIAKDISSDLAGASLPTSGLWDLDFDLHYGTMVTNVGYYQLAVGMSSAPASSNFGNVNQDGYCLVVTGLTGGTTNRYRIYKLNGTKISGGTGSIATFTRSVVSNQIDYCRLSSDGTNITLSLFNDIDRITLNESQYVSIDTGITDLKYIKAGIYDEGASNSVSADIKKISLYEGVSSPTPATWTMEPTYETDFTTSKGWGMSGDKVTVDTTAGKCKFTLLASNGTDRIYQPLGRTLSDKFICQWDFLQTAISASHHYYMVSLTAGTGDPQTSTQNGIMARYTTNTANNRDIGAGVKVGAGSYTHKIGDDNKADYNNKIYFTMIRNVDNLRLIAYSDSTRTTVISDKNADFTETVTGLNTLILGAGSASSGGTLSAEIDNFIIYDGITSI